MCHNTSLIVGHGYISTCDESDIVLLYENWYIDSREGQKKDNYSLTLTFRARRGWAPLIWVFICVYLWTKTKVNIWLSNIFQSFRARISIVLSFPDNLKTVVMFDFQATRWGQGANSLFTFMALPLGYFQLCFVRFVVYILCVISYLRVLLTPGWMSNKSNAECVFDYYVRADKQHKW